MTSYRQTMSQALEYMYFVKETNVLERELTDKELKRREEIAKDLDDQEFKDRYGKDWMQVKMGTATKMAKAEDLEEKASVSLAKKAEKSGISASILKQVYNRGVAAWRTGHRPGTTPEQWGHARVNSFISKSSGTWGGADKDLAAKARGQKEEFELDEGKMSQIDQMMKDGKSAEEIAKSMKMKVKDVKKIMGEETELDEGVIDKVKQVASKKQAMKIDGVMVDTFTASAISQIYDKVNDANKKKMDNLPITKLANLAMKMMQKNEFVPEEVELDEDGHTDVSSAVRKCMTITEDAQDINSKLRTMSPEDSLPSWWTNKLAVASNDMNKMRDYIVNPVQEEVELDEKVIHNVEFEFQVDMGIDERDAMEKTITKFAKKHKLYRPERDMAALEKTRRFRVSDYNGGKDVNNFFKDLQRAGVKVIKQRMIGNNKSTSFGEEVDLDEGKMQDMWQKRNAKSLSVGPFELIRNKNGVHTIKRSGKVLGDFSYDSDADNFVANMKGMKGQWTGNDIDSLFTHLQKVHKEELDKEDEPKVKEIIKKLKGASQAHAGQAKDLEKAVQESAAADARRAMRRDPEMKQRAFSKDDSATDDDKKAASKNIMMQMRKAQSLKGRFDVEFQDGKKVKIPAKLAMAVQNKYNSLPKPADKEKFQAKIGKSYRDMLKALKESAENPDYKAGGKAKADEYRNKAKQMVGVEAVSPAQQAAIAISKKERGEKPKKESILDRIDRKIKENKNG